MPNKNIYLPVDLAVQLEALDINLSAFVQDALRREIESQTKRCSRCGAELRASLS